MKLAETPVGFISISILEDNAIPYYWIYPVFIVKLQEEESSMLIVELHVGYPLRTEEC